MDDMAKNDYLVHYGVLGMKWGVRKQRSLTRKSAYYDGRGEAYGDVASASARLRDSSKGLTRKYYDRINQQWSKASDKSFNKSDKYLEKRAKHVNKHVEKMQKSGKEYADKYINQMRTLRLRDLSSGYNAGYRDGFSLTPGYKLTNTTLNVMNERQAADAETLVRDVFDQMGVTRF